MTTPVFSPPTHKYIVLFDGCDTEDIEYCEELHEAYSILAQKCKTEDLTDKHPRIEVYQRNQKGDYIMKSVIHETSTRIRL